MRTLFLMSWVAAAAGATSALAQTVQVGAIGGVPITDSFRYHDESRPYLVGPSVELRLFNQRFGVELDAIYRRTGASVSGTYNMSNPDGTYVPAFFANVQRGNTWEFPLLGKYYFRDRNAAWRPFLGTGYTFRSTWLHAEYVSQRPGQAPAQSGSDFRSGLEIGATIIGGVELKTKSRFSLQPQFRYTRYGDNTTQLQRGQTDFVLGIRF